jgi:hypothetical protein
VQILNGSGQIVHSDKIQVPQVFSALQLNRYVRAADLDGDGRDTLLRFRNDELWATRDGWKPARWRWRPPGGAGEIVGVVPGNRGRSATVAVQSGAVVYGLDGKSGKERWRCDGPAQAGNQHVTSALLPAADPRDLPRVLFRIHKQSGGAVQTVCRLPLVVGAGGKLLPPAETPATFGPPAPDNRYVVELPWAPARLFGVSEAWGQIGLLLLWALPLPLLLWAIRRRSWRLALVLLVYIALADALFAWLEVMPGPATSRRLQELVLAVIVPLLLLPAVVFVRRLYGATAGRQWGRAGWWLALATVLTPPVAAYWLWQFRFDVEAGRHYTWGGWYLVWFAGAYAAGVVAVLGSVVRYAYRRARRLRRRVSLRPRPA